MKDFRDRPAQFTDLQGRAEKLLQTKQKVQPLDLPPEDAARLIHELQMHQVELELKNEELRQVQARLEESRNKYSHLYDFAPVGYVTLDQLGKIVEANFSAASLLGCKRGRLLGEYLPLFMPYQDQKSFRKLLGKMADGQKRRGEFHLENKNGQMLVLLLDVLLGLDAKGQKSYLVSLTDITEVKQVQKELRLHREDLEKVVANRTAELLQVNEQLWEANENLQALFTAAPLAIGVFDYQGKTVSVNPASERIFGWTKEELVGRLPLYIPPESPEESLEVWEWALQGEPFIGVGMKQSRKDGSLIDVSFSAAPLYDAVGKIRGFIGLAEDITERRRAAEDLKTQARVLASMAEGVNVTDQHGDIIYTNPAFNLMFGYAPGELVGRHSNLLNYYPPENNVNLVNEILRKVKSSGVWAGEFHSCKKNGNPFYTAARISALTVGGKKLYISVQEDITERRRAEKLLHESEDRFRKIFENAAIGVSITDWNGRFQRSNPAYCAMLGYTEEELREIEFSSLIHPEDWDANMEQIHLLQEGKLPFFEIENRYVHKDGHPIWVHKFVSVLTDSAGRPAHMFALVTDTTARRAAEQALRESREDLNLAQTVAQTGSWRINAQPYKLTWSEENYRILGIPQGTSVTYKTFLHAVHPEDRDDVDQKWQAALKGEPYEIEHRVVVDGQVKWVRNRADLKFDRQGRFLGCLGTTQDITAHKQAEEALRTSEERLSLVLKATNEGIYDCDLVNNTVWWNEVYDALFGERFQDTRLNWNWWIDSLHPEDRYRVLHSFTKAIEEGPDLFAEEYRFQKADGSYVYVHDRALVARDASGRAVRMLGAMQDITRRKEMEEALRRARDELEERVARRTASLALANEQLLQEIAERQRVEDRLRESEARFAAFMEHLPGLAVMRDLQGRHIFGNAAWEKVIGKTKDATCQKTQEEIWPPEIARELQKLDQQMLQAGEPLDSLITLELADGSHHFLANRFPIKDQQGVPYMIGGIGIDVTARLRAEEEARKQTRLFEAFFDNSLTPLVFLDPQFNFIRVNQAYARACHREPDEFVGLNHFDLYPSNVRPIFAEVLTTKVPYQAVARPFSLPDHPEWGVTFWDWSLVPIVDDQGEVDFLVYSQQDVTDRVKAEEARSRLVEILENTPDIVGIADYHGKLNYLNRAGRAMVGVEENKDISGQKVLQFHPPWVKKLILEEGSPTAMREGAWKGESALLNGKGREIPISQVILAHRDRAGQMEFFSTICRDISDLKEAQESIARRGAILGAINRILREAMASETGEELGLACLEVTRELTFSQFGFIFEFFEEDKLETLACSGPCCDQGNISRLREWLQRQIINQEGGGARSMREGRAFWANDLADNPDMAEIAEGHPPLIAYLGMPLMYEGRTLGLLGLGNKAGGYTPGDQEDMEILAPAITEALIHFRYKQDLNISAKKLRYLADQLLTTQEKERKRLATELHDELGHSLLVMKFHLRAIAGRLLPEQKTIKEEINDHLAVIEGVINEVRRLYHDLTPGNIEDLGLTQALVTLIEDFAANQPEITWQVDLKDLDGLFSPPLETIIYRLVQEALTNIGKHAHPSAVTVTASLEQEKVRLAIEDNGQGFEVAEVQTRKGHHRGLGLATMEERMNMVGGSLQIQSKKKAGTRLTFTIPMGLKEDKL